MKILSFVALFFALASQAAPTRIQILHTNDLHSFFEGTRDGQGGYARLKTLADQLKDEAHSQGIETLFLDGGDFGEGSSFFVTDRGVNSLRMLDLLGIEVTVVGNHDYMQGGGVLAEQLRRSGLKAKVLSANFKGNLVRQLGRRVTPTTIVRKAGLKIGLAGLTTADFHYQYPLLSAGYINHPLNEQERLEKWAKAQKLDAFIMLTHIGLNTDKTLVSRSSVIDLVVGGHSHTRLEAPVTVANSKGRQVPIVQTGAHTIALGQIILEVDQDKNLATVASYRLHDVTAVLAEDPEVRALVDEARIQRESYFGRRWDDPVGETTFELSGYRNGTNDEEPSCWGRHLARLTKQVGRAHVGIHLPAFNGERIAPGPLTFGDLVDNFPHFRNFGDDGWEIVTLTMPGYVVSQVFRALGRAPNAMEVDGADLRRGTIGGRSIESGRNYKLAVPSEFAYGIGEFFPPLRAWLRRAQQRTGVSYWKAIEAYVQENSPLVCLEAE